LKRYNKQYIKSRQIHRNKPQNRQNKNNILRKAMSSTGSGDPNREK
jgi:hypothetical protein